MKTVILSFLFAGLFLGDSSITENVPAERKKLVRLYPNPTINGKINVVSTEPGLLHLYLFDKSGSLVKQVLLNYNSKKVISGLTKGEYEYDVFRNNEGMQRGKILVK